MRKATYSTSWCGDTLGNIVDNAALRCIERGILKGNLGCNRSFYIRTCGIGDSHLPTDKAFNYILCLRESLQAVRALNVETKLLEPYPTSFLAFKLRTLYKVKESNPASRSMETYAPYARPEPRIYR